MNKAKQNEDQGIILQDGIKTVSSARKLRFSVTLTLVLGIISVLFIILLFLALADIGHGGEDLTLEWHIAGISIIVLVVFVISTFVTIGYLMKNPAMWK
jgi:hypothetical protein